MALSHSLGFPRIGRDRELKKALLSESKAKSGKGRGGKAEAAKGGKPSKHRKGPPKAETGGNGGGPRKRKAKS